MKTVLEEIANRLRNGDYKNEEHVRVAIVNRLLQQLGWNIWNPIEVNPEFSPIRSEDSTRVDIAVFLPPQHLRPAIFVEVKAVGKLAANLEIAERQLRDYNRNNQAEISVLTDGQLWRLYWAGAAGEFKQKCFEDVDLLDAGASFDEIESTFLTFLSQESLISGKAVDQARIFLRRTDDQRTMHDVLPLALRDAELDPTTSKVDCFIKRCFERAVVLTPEDAKSFILEKKRLDLSPIAHPSKEYTTCKPPKKTPSFGDHSANSPDNAGILLLVGRNGAHATGKHLPTGRFLVFSGSVSGKPAEHFPTHNYYRTYQRLIQDGVLQPVDGDMRHKLSQDYEFDSPSAAAAMFLGRAGNPKNWKPNR